LRGRQCFQVIRRETYILHFTFYFVGVNPYRSIGEAFESIPSLEAQPLGKMREEVVSLSHYFSFIYYCQDCKTTMMDEHPPWMKLKLKALYHLNGISLL
jgi:hypothetical protein